LPSFLRDIFPILRSGSDILEAQTEAGFLTDDVLDDLPALTAHGGETFRQQLVDLLSSPTTTPSPRQATLLSKWVAGNFLDDFGLRGEPYALTPAELDRGPLDHALASGTAWDLSPEALTTPENFLEPFRFDLDAIDFGVSRNGLAEWQTDLQECPLLWPSQTTLLIPTDEPGSNGGGLWSTRGFVRRAGTGLYLDESCRSQKVPKTDDVLFVVDHHAARRILKILGGGLGDGTVVVMTPHGPVVIGPGDPGYRRAKKLARDFGGEARKLANRKQKKGKGKPKSKSKSTSKSKPKAKDASKSKSKATSKAKRKG
jgi:hypothetical protein